jgi:hypothetical protein
VLAGRPAPKVLSHDKDGRASRIWPVERKVRSAHVLEQKLAIAKAADPGQKPRRDDPVCVDVVHVIDSDPACVPVKSCHARESVPARKKPPQFLRG